MQPKGSLQLGIGLIITGVLGAALLVGEPEVRAHDNHYSEQSELHEQMHRMMDAMMGEGFSERMHEAMPGSEQMMDTCTRAMEKEGMSDMGNMMNGMDGMMDDDMGGWNRMMPYKNGMMRDR